MKALGFLFCLFALPASAGGFSDWAAIVVAGDSYAHSGKHSAVFDNGRTTIARELVSIGFAPENIRQFSDRPNHYPEGHPAQSTPRNIARGLAEAANRARGGCLAYLTSHGDEEGIGIGDYALSPRSFARMVDKACSGRPAVLIVSACYSGVFVPALKAPDRVVLTAAAADRSSFGCGETDKYTYFDTCAVEALPNAGDFETFGKQAIACVKKREQEEQVDLPSNPQLAVGPMAAVIPHWARR
jgi:hypothetical protein